MLKFPQGSENEWRFEYKYRLTYQHYLQVRGAILPFMRKDSFTGNPEQKRYTVRSLYFDSHDLRSYVEKINGDSDRVKLRIRAYQSSPRDDLPIRVELKARKGMAMEKHSAWASMQDYEYFMTTWHWPEANDPVLSEFERYVHLKMLRPKVLVEYQREGYLSRVSQEVRVTFDHHVHGARAKEIFPTNAFFRAYYPGLVVFEIKCDKRQPRWLRTLVQDQDLRLNANSKFAQGIEIAQPDIIRSTWSNS